MQQPGNSSRNNRYSRHSFQPANWQVELPLTYPCQIYPRVSTPEQTKNVSAEMQKDKTFALSCGWTDEHIILDVRDLGVSGQLRMEERLAFNDMLRRIANNQIKAVVAVNVDRLFRNKWGDESGKFMEICYRYGVIVVTPDFVYDFRINWHIDRFKRRCEEAWNYLEYHVYGRLHVAQDERGYAGFWVGGNIPMGYILDTRERIDGRPNPNYYRYIVYEPHAEVIRWIFRRLKELNGNVTTLMVEIEKKPFLFPDFEDSVDPFVVRVCFSQNTHVAGGYTIVTDRGLRCLLANRAYIGYWIYKKELVSTHNHEAIVALDLFTYAYHRLSNTKLDGTPNEETIAFRKQYIKQHVAEKPAILKECIYAADPTVRIYAKDWETTQGVLSHYCFYPSRRGNCRQSASYAIGATGLDAVVLARLRERLQQTDTEQAFDNFMDAEDAVVTEASETLRDIARDIAATTALIARIKEQITSGKLTNPDLIQLANDSYEAAKKDLTRLEEKQKATSHIAQEDEERRSYRQLLKEVGDAWDEIVLPEDHPRLVYLFIHSVILEIVSPNFFTVRITWRDSTWGSDYGLCYKDVSTRTFWTPEEKAIIRTHYATATRRQLLELLPRRNFRAMSCYVKSHDLGLVHPVDTNDDSPSYVCLEDWRVMQQYGITEAQVKEWKSVKLIQWALVLLF